MFITSWHPRQSPVVKTRIVSIPRWWIHWGVSILGYIWHLFFLWTKTGWLYCGKYSRESTTNAKNSPNIRKNLKSFLCTFIGARSSCLRKSREKKTYDWTLKWTCWQGSTRWSENHILLLSINGIHRDMEIFKPFVPCFNLFFPNLHHIVTFLLSIFISLFLYPHCLVIFSLFFLLLFVIFFPQMTTAATPPPPLSRGGGKRILKYIYPCHLFSPIHKRTVYLCVS